jgi:hypothetical protein
MTAALHAATYERLRSEAAWKLLSADLAPDVLALLQHLLFDTQRSLPASVLYERLTTELSELRLQGRHLQGSAAQYVGQWLREGWLERRFPEGAPEEEFELSAASQQALRVVASLHTNRAVATESRLSLVMDELSKLSRDTDPDPTSRLRVLQEERRRLDAQIAAVASGEVAVLEDARAVERLREIVSLAQELTEDFRRVRDDFARLYRQFRERILLGEGHRGAVLEDLFAGVDVIADSGPGRTFSAFWNLLNDPEQSALLEASVDALSARPFVQQVGRDDRRFLLGLTRTLLERAGSVNNTQTGFARSLRSFVQTKEYQEQRRLTHILQSATALALPVRDRLRPENPTGFELRLPIATFRSLGRLKLHDPVQPIQPAALEAAEQAEISIEDIAGQVALSEIDFRSLGQHIRTVLEFQPQCSVGGVLQRFPATQGLGSIVGYVFLGTRHGQVASDHRERVGWLTSSGESRFAHIPLIYFFQEQRDDIP